jgi:hypothetical protein
MNQLETFFKIPLVKAFAHILLVVLVIFNIQYLFILQVRNKELALDNFKNSRLLLEIEDLRSNENYLKSDIYKQKEIKNAGYAKNGEKVVDFSSLEPDNLNLQISQKDYIEELPQIKENNIEKWMSCIFGVGEKPRLSENQEINNCLS